MKKRHFIGLGLIAAFFLFSAFNFKNSLTPYVTFSEAKSINGIVQVKGVLVSDSISQGEGSLKFILRDERGEEKIIDYHGAKPDGLEQSTSIVAVGKLNNGHFTAEKLLLKCPSKYQGAGSVNK